jgi:hypothetical protein
VGTTVLAQRLAWDEFRVPILIILT